MHGKRFNWNADRKPSIIQGRSTTGKNKLAESIGRAISTSQDVKIPDGPIVIDKDLLQEIRNLLNNGADEYVECEALRDKLDSLYPYLAQPGLNQ